MKTNRSMPRTLGLLALSMLAVVTAPEVRADAIQPRYRIEDLGLLSKWGGTNPRFYLDGTVHRYDQMPGSPLNVGDYRLVQIWPQGQPEKVLLYQGESTQNLLNEEQSRKFAFTARDLTADGKLLIWNEPDTGSYSVLDVKSGEWTVAASSPTIGEPGSKAQVFAINTMGQMVGQQDSKAILYDSFDATPMLLKDLVQASDGWHFTEASDISETGDIIVTAYSDFKQGAYALKLVPITPVPEPATWLILSLGGLWIFRKRVKI